MMMGNPAVLGNDGKQWWPVLTKAEPGWWCPYRSFQRLPHQPPSTLATISATELNLSKLYFLSESYDGLWTWTHSLKYSEPKINNHRPNFRHLPQNLKQPYRWMQDSNQYSFLCLSSTFCGRAPLIVCTFFTICTFFRLLQQAGYILLLHCLPILHNATNHPVKAHLLIFQKNMKEQRMQLPASDRWEFLDRY